MHHRGQRRIHRHPPQQPPQLLTISHITRHDLNPRAQPLQLLTQLQRTRSPQTPTRGQHHTAHPMHRHHMPGHQSPQHARPTRDQHRARRIQNPIPPLTISLPDVLLGGDQSGYPHRSAAQGELPLPRPRQRPQHPGERADQHLRRGIQIGQRFW